MSDSSGSCLPETENHSASSLLSQRYPLNDQGSAADMHPGSTRSLQAITPAAKERAKALIGKRVSADTATDVSTPASASFIDRFCRQQVFRKFADMQFGGLTVIDWTGTTHLGTAASQANPLTGSEPDNGLNKTAGNDTDLHVTINVVSPRFYRDVALGGIIGVAESYMRGEWTADNLTLLVRLFVRNLAIWSSMQDGWTWLTRPVHQFFHFLHKNTRGGSKLNIAAHYDLGNEFFRLFLDPTLMYSAGIFPSQSSTMEEASHEKNDRICRKLDLKPTDHVLEIGTGWGGFALHAAREYGCRITTTTISAEQHALAQQRIAEAGLSDRVTLLQSDYRDLEGSYDKLVSIEMIEAVGHQFLGTYFAKLSRLLKPQGMALVQAITIQDQFYDEYIRSVDFIQRYIFPGGCLPSVSGMLQCVKQATDMRLFHLEDLTPHYAETLIRWRERFFENIEQIRGLGYPESFLRMWEFYLCYCEGGFHERTIGSVHLLLTKPLCRRESLTPSLS